jgi:parallel beta-helix repeat protein
MTHYKFLLCIIIIILCAFNPFVYADIINDSKVIKVGGGEIHTLILLNNGSVWSCGDNSYFELGIESSDWGSLLLVPVHDGDMTTPSNYLENITDIAAGWKHSLALDVNGFVWAWGNNDAGELGNGDNYQSTQSAPVKVHGPGNVGYLDGIVSIAAGRSGEFSLAIDVNSNCWTFGKNWYGQLGDNTTISKIVPVAVRAGEQDTNNPNGLLRYITCIKGGAEFSAALDANGFVYTWGRNSLSWNNAGYGHLGNGSTIRDINWPVRVHAGQQNPADPCSPLKNIVKISCGWEHTLTLERLNPSDPNCRGRVYAWGHNNRNYGGELGDGTTTIRNSPVFVHAGEQNPSNPDSNLEGIISVSAGAEHSIALDANCGVWAWGGNLNGQLGNADTNIVETRPVKVLRFDNQPLLGITSICAGYYHNLAIDSNGILWVWGNNQDGRLGLGDTDNRNLAYPRPPVFNTTKGTFRFDSIQNAINDANNGDVLELLPCPYNEQDINFGIKSLTLKGTNPADWGIVEKTTIRGKGDNPTDVPILRFNGNTGSTVSGLTLYNCDYGILTQNSSSPRVERCVIRNNFTNGVYASASSSPHIASCKFFGNPKGIQISSATADVKNCWIYKNSYGVYTAGSTSPCIIRNNTFVSNSSAIYNSSGTAPVITSSIFRSNSSDLYNCTANYSWLTTNGDPCFVNADGNDFHLRPVSPCIDAGDPCFMDFNETDIDGQCRVMFGKSDERVDIGADEFAPKADYNGDSIVNFVDFANLARRWRQNDPNISLDGDNDVDIYDLAQYCDDWLWIAQCSQAYQSFAEQSEDVNISAESEAIVSTNGTYVINASESSATTASMTTEQATVENQQQSIVSEESATTEPVDEQQQSSLAGEGQTAGIWLVYDGNMMPAYGDEITVYIHSDPTLFCMEPAIEVAGDANITTAMSEADCNNFGWDNGWNSDPYIDPAGWLYLSGVSFGGVVNGAVGYFKFRYYSGEVTVSITEDSCAYDANLAPVLFSGQPLLFGRDPNEQ